MSRRLLSNPVVLLLLAATAAMHGHALGGNAEAYE